jgi:hypothetical protein
VGKPGGKRPLGRHSVYGKIILKRILNKSFGRVWIGFFWLRTELGYGLL